MECPSWHINNNYNNNRSIVRFGVLRRHRGPQMNGGDVE